MPRITRQIHVGNVAVGGGAPVSVQSMCNTDTRDVAATGDQIRRLAEAGCEIVRCAVPDAEAARALQADPRRQRPAAHRRYPFRLPAGACRPGGGSGRLAAESGQHRRGMESARGGRVPAASGRCRSASASTAARWRRNCWKNTGIRPPKRWWRAPSGISASWRISISRRSRSASRPPISAARWKPTGCSRHRSIIRCTSASPKPAPPGAAPSRAPSASASCSTRGSAIPCASPSPAIRWRRSGSAGRSSRSLELREHGPVFVSCPTCGRCQIDLIPVAEEVERRLRDLPRKITVAVMGCVVNGPGEAREADVGIAGGKGQGLLFRRGEVVRKVPERELADALVEEAQKMAAEINVREGEERQ